MNNNELYVYALNEKEIDILKKNSTIKEVLRKKDIEIYLYLKRCGELITVTDLVRKCLTEAGHDINDPQMYKLRKKPKSQEFYDTMSFWGKDKFRVDSFSRSLNKLVKFGLVKKHDLKTYTLFETIIK